MKKQMKVLFFIAISAVFISQTAYSQKDKAFKGMITYEINYSGKNLTPAEKAQLPSEVYEKVLGNKSRVEYIVGGMSIISIFDGDTKNMTIILVGPQGKAYVKLTPKEVDKYMLDDTEIKIKYLEETKVIAGYTCKKAEITETNETGEEVTYFVFYSKELGSKERNYTSKYKDIDGLLAEYQEQLGEDVTQQITAKEIKKGKVKDIDFLIPSDSKEITGEQREAYLQMFSQ